MARATVVLLHGEVERPERLGYASARLNSAGYRVVTPDLSGTDHTSGGRRYRTALAKVGDRISSEAAADGRPVVLMGDGTGASLALHHAIAHGDELCGIILVAPLAQEPRGPWKRVFSLAGETLLPDATPITLDPQEAMRDSRTVADWIVDPLTRLGPINASSANQKARRAAKIMDGVDTITLSTLLLWGHEEGLTPSGGAQHLLGALTHAQLTRRSFDCLYADVLSSAERETVLDTTISWLEEQVA